MTNHNGSDDEENSHKKSQPLTLADLDKYQCCKTLKDELIRLLKEKAAEEDKRIKQEEDKIKNREAKRKQDHDKRTKPRRCCWGCLTCCYRKNKKGTKDKNKKEKEKEEEEEGEEEENEEKRKRGRKRKKKKKESEEERFKKMQKRRETLEAMFGQGCYLQSCGYSQKKGLESLDKTPRVCRTGIEESDNDEEDDDEKEGDSYDEQWDKSAKTNLEALCKMPGCSNVEEASHAAQEFRVRRDDRKRRATRKKIRRRRTTCGPGDEDSLNGDSETLPSCCTGGGGGGAGQGKTSRPRRPPVGCQVRSCKYNRETRKFVCEWAEPKKTLWD